MATDEKDQIYFKLDENKPIASQVYDYLKNAIIECRYKPFDRVSENEIAALFNISRQPVREALIRLANNNFVTIEPKKATRVSCISKESIRQGCQIRIALEGHAVALTAEHINQSQLARLEDNLEAQKIAAIEFNLHEHFALDDVFHRMLIEMSGLNQMWDIVEGVKGTMDRVRFLSIENELTPIHTTCFFHESIIKAISEHDTAAAHKAMSDHINNTYISLQSVMDKCTRSYFID